MTLMRRTEEEPGQPRPGGPVMAGVLGRRSHTVLGLLWLACSWNLWAAEPCSPALARVVSVQGQVELRRGSAPWASVELNAPLCSGDTLRVHAYSRAALLLSNETTLRLDQGTTLTLAPPEAGKATLLQQLSGALHMITRTPRAFNVKTPFVNANVEGTEFSVRVDDSSATVAVIEGTVLAVNEAGSERLAGGEAATATRDGAPRKDLLIRPVDAVAWTLYFPAVLDRKARAPQAPDTAATAVDRASQLLLVGRVEEARAEIARALNLEPARSDAQALLSVVAVVENEKDKALELASQAVRNDPASAGRIKRSLRGAAPSRIAVAASPLARRSLPASLTASTTPSITEIVALASVTRTENSVPSTFALTNGVLTLNALGVRVIMCSAPLSWCSRVALPASGGASVSVVP
ncbi:MAG: hypothetical protein E6H79_16435 [Betaproteobacteria bacterium]|nr:MAG: hypothetical protein E6H79_16435 [Betaproteobacteria bacterium]